MRAFRRTPDRNVRASARITRPVPYTPAPRRTSWGFAEGTPPTDALALVRSLPHTVRSFAHVKAAAKLGLFARFERYWLELRGTVVLLIYDDAAWTASRPDAQEHAIAAVFSALGCDVVQVRTGKFPVLRLRKLGSTHTIWLRFESDDECVHWEKALSRVAMQRVVGISDFEFISPIGKGASGKVFLVRDRQTGEKLAMKVIDKTKVFETRSAFRHALDERLALELVDGHPFFTRLRHAFQTRSNFYLVIDFYEGGDLYQYLRTHNGRLPEAQARVVAAEVALALEHLHTLGFVYRDLKPENVLLDSEGHVRLADFGLCKKLPSSTNLTSTICGTHTYAAPEMLASRQYGVSVDLWAFGTFIYHILRGRTPYEARDLDQVIANMNNRRIRFSANTPRELVQIIKRLLDWNPETRLGCGNRGMNEIRNDPFFRDIDWRKIYHRDPNPNGLFGGGSPHTEKATTAVDGEVTSKTEKTSSKSSADSKIQGFSSARNSNEVSYPEQQSEAGEDSPSTPNAKIVNPSSESPNHSGEAASTSGSSVSPQKIAVDISKPFGKPFDILNGPAGIAVTSHVTPLGPHTEFNVRKTVRASLWDGMVAAAESDDLRNFDMAEWGKVSVDHDEDDDLYGDASLWPISKSRQRLEDDRMIAGFSYSSSSTPIPLPPHL